MWLGLALPRWFSRAKLTEFCRRNPGLCGDLRGYTQSLGFSRDAVLFPCTCARGVGCRAALAVYARLRSHSRCSRIPDNASLLLPNCHLCFIDAGAASILQPLDIGYFRSFKNHMAPAWAEACAGEVLATTSGIGLVTKTPALRANLTQLVGSAMDFVNTPQRGLASWKHLLVDPSQIDSILAEADALRGGGRLFSKLEKALPEPELPDAVAVIPEAMPTSSSEQLSKWVALALVYGNPSKSS